MVSQFEFISNVSFANAPYFDLQMSLCWQMGSSAGEHKKKKTQSTVHTKHTWPRGQAPATLPIHDSYIKTLIRTWHIKAASWRCIWQMLEPSNLDFLSPSSESIITSLPRTERRKTSIQRQHYGQYKNSVWPKTATRTITACSIE